MTDAEAEFIRIVAERHPRQPEARHHRQLPGRLGGDDARRRAIRISPARSSSTARRCRTGRATTANRRCATRAACWAAPGCRCSPADLGAGKFDGANLVSNFENLNPANTLWDKWYHLFENIDTEPERFLEFERWWGGFYCFNEEEIRWIVDNLFVGNKLASRRGAARSGPLLRPARRSSSRSSCSRRWATTSRRRSRRSTGSPTCTRRREEIKANGQTIVGLLHEDVGHLGIFVSGPGREEGARADRRGAEVHPAAAARALRHAHRGAPRRGTARSPTR